MSKKTFPVCLTKTQIQDLLAILESPDVRASAGLPATSRLISLKDFNGLVRKEVDLRYLLPKRNGIACPECGCELHDLEEEEDAFEVMKPGSVKVGCPACEWAGNRLSG